MPALYMTVPELAERWAISGTAATIYRLIQRGKLPALSIEGTKRIPISAVEAFESANTTGGGK